MTEICSRYSSHCRAWVLAATLLLAAVAPAFSQQDRERAQLMQMQQQLQRMQSDNAELQSSERDVKEKLKQETQATQAAQRDAKRLRAESEAQAKEAVDLRGQLADAKAALAAAQTQIEQLHKDVGQRDQSLEEAAEKQRRTESAANLVWARLKLQTARADQCDAKHAEALAFAGGLIDRIQHDRLRLCEPFTGLWKVKAETDIQALREKLQGLQLESVQVETTQSRQ